MLKSKSVHYFLVWILHLLESTIVARIHIEQFLLY